MSMRMRRKRNFDERMAACGEFLLAKGTAGILNMKEAAENFRALIDFSAAFGNEHPVELEIGAGKGGFIIEKAKSCPEVNYLALEKMSNVILTPMERVAAENIPNVKFLNIRAECLPCYIPENSLESDLPEFFYAASEARVCFAAAYSIAVPGKIQKIASKTAEKSCRKQMIATF